MATNVPPQYSGVPSQTNAAQVRPAEPDLIDRLWELDKQIDEAAHEHLKAREQREKTARELERGTSDHSNRSGFSSRQR